MCNEFHWNLKNVDYIPWKSYQKYLRDNFVLSLFNIWLFVKLAFIKEESCACTSEGWHDVIKVLYFMNKIPKCVHQTWFPLLLNCSSSKEKMHIIFCHKTMNSIFYSTWNLTHCDVYSGVSTEYPKAATAIISLFWFNRNIIYCESVKAKLQTGFNLVLIERVKHYKQNSEHFIKTWHKKKKLKMHFRSLVYILVYLFLIGTWKALK